MSIIVTMIRTRGTRQTSLALSNDSFPLMPFLHLSLWIPFSILSHSYSGRMNEVHVIWILTNFMMADVVSNCCPSLPSSVLIVCMVQAWSCQLLSICLIQPHFQSIRRPWKIFIARYAMMILCRLLFPYVLQIKLICYIWWWWAMCHHMLYEWYLWWDLFA